MFNNPFKYSDPDGQFVFAIPLLVWGSTIALPTFSAIITPILYTAAITTAAYAGSYLAKAINKTSDDVYAPDRDLPKDKYGKPVPDENAKATSHTQLGTRNGSKGKYVKGREFDENDERVRDIEFSDHGYPENHPVPHQHRFVENDTGGTRRKVEAEPLPEWNYY